MLEDKDLLSIQEVRTKVDKAYAAWQKYRDFSQEQVDAIVERMAAAARANAKRLADLAVEETGYGNAKDKYVKNLLCCDWLPRRMRGMKTIGILRELPEERIVEIGVPVGVVAAILPTTNPTSTAIYKTLISLKAGNAIVISPHPRAHSCTCETAADPLPRGARSRRARRHHPVRRDRHHRRHQRPDAARAHRRHPLHRRRGHRARPPTRAASRPSASDRATCRCWWTPRPISTTPSRRSSPASRSITAPSARASRPSSPSTALRDRIVSRAQGAEGILLQRRRRQRRSASC